MSIARNQLTPIYDLDMARRLFQMIERDDSFTLQTFDDVPKGVKGDPALATSISWPAGDPAGQQRVWNKILSLYERGAGVFFTVNRTDGTGRKRENIPSIRGAWRENDNGCTTELPLQPSLTVESSPGKFHEYILASITGQQMRRAALNIGRSRNGSSRVTAPIRTPRTSPGYCAFLVFLHRKDRNNPHHVRIVASPGWRYRSTEDPRSVSAGRAITADQSQDQDEWGYATQRSRTR